MGQFEKDLHRAPGNIGLNLSELSGICMKLAHCPDFDELQASDGIFIFPYVSLYTLHSFICVFLPVCTKNALARTNFINYRQ